MQQQFRFEGCLTPEQARRDPYVYLPFSVPRHARRIDVSYEFFDPCVAPFGMGPGSVLDIGIFDSRGREFLDGTGSVAGAGPRAASSSSPPVRRHPDTSAARSSPASGT